VEEKKRNAGPKTSMNEESVGSSAVRWATRTQVVRATLTASCEVVDSRTMSYLCLNCDLRYSTLFLYHTWKRFT
jgi:hypothetical protein